MSYFSELLNQKFFSSASWETLMISAAFKSVSIYAVDTIWHKQNDGEIPGHNCTIKISKIRCNSPLKFQWTVDYLTRIHLVQSPVPSPSQQWPNVAYKTCLSWLHRMAEILEFHRIALRWARSYSHSGYSKQRDDDYYPIQRASSANRAGLRLGNEIKWPPLCLGTWQ